MDTKPENEIVPKKYEEPVDEEGNGWVVATIIFGVLATVATIFAIYLWYVFRIELIQNAAENIQTSGDSMNPAGEAAGVLASVFVGVLGLAIAFGVLIINFVFTGIIFGVNMRKTFKSHTWRKKLFIVMDVLFGLENITMLLFFLLTFITF